MDCRPRANYYCVPFSRLVHWLTTRFWTLLSVPVDHLMLWWENSIKFYDLLNEEWVSGLRTQRRRFVRIRNKFHSCIYPSSVEFLLTIIAFELFVHFVLSIDPSFGIVNWLAFHIYGFIGRPANVILSCVSFSFGLWLLKVFLIRYALRAILLYNGWMYETHSKGPSLVTRMWFLLMKALTAGSRPQLYSYQGILPRLPLPSLDDTIDRYLLSIRPFCDDQRLEQMTQLALSFRNTVGPQFQRYLWLKSWWANNYVSDWWEEFVYLRGRAPLMVNSNVYCMEALDDPPTHKQTARAANFIYAFLLFRKQIDRQELKPMMVQKAVPLCSLQYRRCFNTTRIPGLEIDRLQHLDDSSHLTVMHQGKFYQLTIHHRGRLLKPRELQSHLDLIMADDSPALPGEKHLASLTAMDRVSWSKIRDQFFANGTNGTSLRSIESSAFVVVLDAESLDLSDGQLDRYGQRLLHGNGDNLWFDKSVNLVVGKNARLGGNADHSWADAPIVTHLWEFALHQDRDVLGYDSQGNCRVGTMCYPSVPVRLKWDLPDALISVIDQSFKDAQRGLNDADLRILHHKSFGKGFIKGCRVSPDAFIQMAFQLAYKRDIGCLSFTYESSMTRMFREGRTETLRSVTVESAKFVESMLDPTACNGNRRQLLLEACARHRLGYQDAMCGKGVDRHLFSLFIISKYLGVDSDFLKEALSVTWNLSTSQVGMIGKIMATGGGFGPSTDDGYGVFYLVGEDQIFFHISSKRSSSKTDSLRFKENIGRALNDLRTLFSH